MYAIVKTGGKQYRVEEGQSLLVERLRASAEGDTVALDPLLFVDGKSVVDGSDLSKVTVSARVVGHERGPKLRVVKFKPKRGYKRRTGHRQELTRIEVTQIKLAARRSRAKAAAGEAGAGEAAAGERSAAAGEGRATGERRRPAKARSTPAKARSTPAKDPSTRPAKEPSDGA